eukprot:scaffold15423_cov70-Phaeocystis_antarctica.AAC.4
MSHVSNRFSGSGSRSRATILANVSGQQTRRRLVSWRRCSLRAAAPPTPRPSRESLRELGQTRRRGTRSRSPTLAGERTASGAEHLPPHSSTRENP